MGFWSKLWEIMKENERRASENRMRRREEREIEKERFKQIRSEEYEREMARLRARDNFRHGDYPVHPLSDEGRRRARKKMARWSPV